MCEVCARLCFCVVVMDNCVCSKKLGALRGHILLSESYRVEPNQPPGRTYHFQHYLTLCLKEPVMRFCPSFTKMTTMNLSSLYSEGKGNQIQSSA